MKNLRLILAFFSAVQIINVTAQITINQSDMPTVNDITVSSTVAASQFNTIDPALTGVNYTWDFCDLQMATQKIDTFISVISTPLAYQLYFNNIILYPNYKADNAKRGQEITFSQAGFGISITEVYNYYKNDATDYKQVGFGAKINGVPSSVQYNGIDFIYRFPMDFGNTDMSDAAFQINVPTLGDYGQKIHRENTVDGWGTITTPLGTFQALRLKTKLNITDTVFVSQFSFGTTVPRPTEYIYSWLAKGHKTPVMTINTRDVNGTETITAVSYEDAIGGSTPCNPTSIETISTSIFSVFPNPSSSIFNIQLKNSFTNVKVSVKNELGQMIPNSYTFSNNTIQLQLQGAKGYYFVEINLENAAPIQFKILKN